MFIRLIFKTFTEIVDDKTIIKTQLFGRELKGIKQTIADVKAGNGFSIFNKAADVDTTKLTAFNNQLIGLGKNASQKSINALYRNLQNTNTATQNAARDMLRLNAQYRSGQITLAEYTAQTQQLTFAQKASAVASKAMGIALNTAFSIGIALAISAIISGISYIVNYMDNLKEKAEETKQAYEDIKSEIDDVNSKITENKKLIDEINVNPLNYTSDKTLTDLQNQNTELAAQKILLEEIAKYKLSESQEAAEKFLDATGIDSDLSNFSSFWDNLTSGNIPEALSLNYGASKYSSVNLNLNDNPTEGYSLTNEIKLGTEMLSELIEERDKIYEDGIISDDEIDNLAEINTQLEYVRKNLASDWDLVNSQKDNLNRDSELYKEITGIQNQYTSLLEYINDNPVFSEINKDYIKAKNKLEKSDEIKLTYNLVGNGGGYSKDIQALFNRDENHDLILQSNDLFTYENNLKKVISTLEKKEILTADENKLLAKSRKELKATTKEIKKYEEVYLSGLTSEAKFTFDRYTANNPLENISNISQFKTWRDNLTSLSNGNDYLKNLLYEMANGAFPQFFGAISKTEAQLPSTTEKIKQVSEALTTLETTVNGVGENTQLFNDAINKLASGKSLTYKEMSKLIELDKNLASKFTSTADGFIIAQKELIGSRNSFATSTKTDIQKMLQDSLNAKKEAQNNINEYKERIAKVSLLTNSPTSSPSVQLDLNTLKNALSSEEENFNNATEATNKYKLALNELSNTADTTSIMLSAMSSSQEFLNKVQKEYSEDNKYSADTINSLINAGIKYTDIIDTETGLYKDISILLKELTQKKYEDEIQTDKNTLAELRYQMALHGGSGDGNKSARFSIETQIAEVEARIKLKEGLLNAYSQTQYTSKSTKTPFDLEYDNLKYNLDKGLIKAEEYYDKLEALNNKYNSGEDKLEDFRKYDVEIYNGRIKLIEELLAKEKEVAEEAKNATSDLFDDRKKYYENLKERVADAYDAEIAAIDKVIEAKKSETDELEKQKSLTEAITKLEDARNQRKKLTFTGGGLMYVKDDTAVKEAEDEVKKIKSDIEIDSLETQKSKLEANKSTSTEYLDVLVKSVDEQKDEVLKRFDTLLAIVGAVKVGNDDITLYEKNREATADDYINLDKTIENGLLKVGNKAINDGSDAYKDYTKVDINKYFADKFGINLDKIQGKISDVPMINRINATPEVLKMYNAGLGNINNKMYNADSASTLIINGLTITGQEADDIRKALMGCVQLAQQFGSKK